MATHIFGIRHHGPGSARSLRNALEALEPDCILVEGPPDAEAVLPLLVHAEMQPPVALLLYMPDEPAQSVYYPFAAYSPEWQAMDYGLKRNLPVRFMDLPQCHRMAIEKAKGAATTQPEGALERSPIAPPSSPSEILPAEILPAPEEAIEVEETEEQAPPNPEGDTPDPLDPETFAIQVRRDPLNWIAEAAGYSDGESWWEHMVEQRRNSADLFQGVQEVMSALREASPPDPDPQEALREAWMRQTIRAAQKEGFQRIAVVCGAWHGPALVDLPPAKADADLLKGLPKAKVAATWVPWTYGRLTMASGYGAGVVSPAWYEHLWHQSDRVVVHWMTLAARLFRAEDLPASPASVIEAVRLAETLAAVRERPLPGLPELWEAAQSIFCYGSPTPMRLIQEKLIVGEKLGHVPDETPMLPIQQDLRKEQKRLRLAPEAAHSDKDFDLRNGTDLERSYLLHRLNLLGVSWGQIQDSGRGKGTFHEWWRLQWHPEFEVKLIEANVWGNTVRAAASRRVQERATEAKELAGLTALVGPTLWADLGEAVDALMSRLESMAAITSDTVQLMEALPDLAELAHRGDVRKTDKGLVSQVVNGLIVRICIGLPAACAALNDEAAAALFPRLMATHNAIKLPENVVHLPVWHATLERLADQVGLHGLIAGRCCYLLLDQHIWETEEVGRRLNLALSLAEDPAQAAAWIEGLLRESGELLVHTDSLWPILNGWVAELPAEVFVQLLPLLRRTFSDFPSGLRRQLGERAKGGASHTRTRVAATVDLDVERAERVLPLVAQMLGLEFTRKRLS